MIMVSFCFSKRGTGWELKKCQHDSIRRPYGISNAVSALLREVM